MESRVVAACIYSSSLVSSSAPETRRQLRGFLKRKQRRRVLHEEMEDSALSEKKYFYAKVILVYSGINLFHEAEITLIIRVGLEMDVACTS